MFFSEGTFLVRDSITSEGDYVLSVVHNEEVHTGYRGISL